MEDYLHGPERHESRLSKLDPCFALMFHRDVAVALVDTEGWVKGQNVGLV